MANREPPVCRGPHDLILIQGSKAPPFHSHFPRDPSTFSGTVMCGDTVCVALPNLRFGTTGSLGFQPIPTCRSPAARAASRSPPVFRPAAGSGLQPGDPSDPGSLRRRGDRRVSVQGGRGLMGCYVSGAKGFKADHKKVSGEIMTCSSCFLYFFVIFSVGWGCHPPNTC